MKKILLILFILSSFNSYGGPIREKIIINTEYLLVYVPSFLMKDIHKTHFLQVFHKEITSRDEQKILEAYLQITGLLGMNDPLKWKKYRSNKEKFDIEKQMKEYNGQKQKKKKNSIPNEVMKDLNKIKDLRKKQIEYLDSLGD